MRAGGWGEPESDLPRQRSAADRYGYPDESDNPGFHTYATSDVYDTNAAGDRWPDNWAPLPAEDVSPSGYDDDDDAPPRRDYLTTLLWAALWYAMPLLVLIGRALLLGGQPDPACVTSGLGGCTSPRADALAELMANSPKWAVALFSALLVAAVLRWASDTWRAATIGFCAAVVAGGATTVLYSISS
jgi:hypothetical protein